MPKLRKRASRYDQLQALLYGQLRMHGTKPENLLGCAARRRRNACGTSTVCRSATCSRSGEGLTFRSPTSARQSGISKW